VTTPLFPVKEPAPEAAGYGLYSAATVLDPDDPHVQSGITWEPTICGLPDVFPVGCPQPDDVFPLDVPEGGLPQVEAPPFGVSSRVRCKPVGTTLERLREIARTRLRLAEQTAVERAYWTGVGWPDDVAAPHLAAGDEVTILSGTPLKAALAFGRLEEAIGGMSGAVGVIHAPRVAFPALKGLVAESRGVMRTELGTRVVFGTGYPGTGPAGEPRTDAVTWLYATGPVQVARGPVIDLPHNLPDALDRETNVATVQAARIVSVGHSCGLVAVPVDLTA
jgi:hypothetical protein